MSIGFTDDQILDVIIEDAAEEALRLAKAIHKGVVARTPVDTGQARRSWNVTVGEARLTTVNKGKGLKSKRFPGQVTSAVRRSKGDVTIHIANAKPYITYLENGSPTTKASGMVSKTLAGLDI